MSTEPQTAFEQYQLEEATRKPTEAGQFAPQERGPLSLQPVSFTDRPTVKDFRALDPAETAPPKEVAEEIERELGADPTAPPVTTEDAPEGPTDPEETGQPSPNSSSSSQASEPEANPGKNKQPVEGTLPAIPTRQTPGSPSAEKTAS